MSKRFSKAVTLLALSVLSTLALAEAPGRVGRIALAEGKVSISAEAGEESNAARINWPVTTSNQITTERGARTEIRIGSTAIRLDGDSALDVVELDDDTLRLHLHYGSASIRVRHQDAARGFELSTPHGRVRLQEAGRVRVDAEREQDTSIVSVFDGVALVDGGGSTLTIRANRRAELRGDDLITGMAQRDAFDDWAAARDRREGVDGRAVAERYVGSEMTGYEELDDYGSWRDDAEYGPLWVPRNVASDWAPYRDGRWTWVQPWGWTWVDNAPWGYAPFHYGRWVVVNKRWCWAPGRNIGRPVWSPALVGWVGGSSWSVNFHSGGYRPAQGWYPLSPRDTYVPHYHVKPDHLRYLNRHARGDHDRHDRHDYRDRRGLTVVPHEHFGRRNEIVVPAIARAQVTPQLVQRAPLAVPPAPQQLQEPRRRELTLPYVERHDGVRVNPRYAAPDRMPGWREGRDGRELRDGRDGVRGAPQVITTDTINPQPGVGYDPQRDQRRRDEQRARWQAEREARANAQINTGSPQVQPQPQPQPQGSGRWFSTARAAMEAQRDERERQRFNPGEHEQRQAPVYSGQRSGFAGMPQQVNPVPRPMPQPMPMPQPQPQPQPQPIAMPAPAPMPQPVMAAPAPQPAPAPAAQPAQSSRNDGPRDARPGRHQMLR